LDQGSKQGFRDYEGRHGETSRQGLQTEYRCHQSEFGSEVISWSITLIHNALGVKKERKHTFTMIRIFYLILALLFVCTLTINAEDPCVSGVPVGRRPGPYSFLVATGPQRGKQTCYICEQHEGNKPSAVVFAHGLTDPLAKLLSKLEAAGTDKKDSGYKVWMTQLTTSADLDLLAKWAQTKGLKSTPVGAFEDADGPPSYKLNKDAEVTIILFAKQKVVANFAFRIGELNDKSIEEVLKAVPQLFEKK
jgi:hypothetical protein